MNAKQALKQVAEGLKEKFNVPVFLGNCTVEKAKTHKEEAQ
jgi:hypothetical protein